MRTSLSPVRAVPVVVLLVAGFGVGVGAIRFALRSPEQSHPAADERPASARPFVPGTSDVRVTPAGLAAKARSAWVEGGVPEADAAQTFSLAFMLRAISNPRANSRGASTRYSPRHAAPLQRITAAPCATRCVLRYGTCTRAA